MPQETEQEGLTIFDKIAYWVQVVFFALIFMFIFQAYFFETVSMPFSAMEDTILAGDKIICDKISYEIRPPKPGDLVVFELPLNKTKVFLKRCVAVAGDTVVIRDKVLYVNGAPFPDMDGTKYTTPSILSGMFSTRDNCGPIIIPSDHIFVMGDNRDISQDSRFWGPLPKKNILGKPQFIYFSVAPDENPPQYTSVFSAITILFHEVFGFPSRIRFDRLWTML